MKEVYSLADKVLVWLGPDADGCDEVMQGLAVMGYLAMHCSGGVLRPRDGGGGQPPVNWGPPGPDEVLFGKLETESEVKELLRKVVPVFVPLVMSGKLEKWLKRSWFSRVWVIQEFCLNKNVLVACGRTMTFGELLCLAQELFSLFERIRANVYALSPTLREDLGQSLAFLQSVPAERMPVRLGHLFGMRLWQRQGRRTPLRNLLERMFTSANGTVDGRVVPQATKYRDRIYGLLGLASDTEDLNFRPDYRRSTSTTEVLTQVARAIIQKEKQLHVLRFAQFPKANVEDDDYDGAHGVPLPSLPSWVPDWANDTECSLALETDYSACGKFLTAEILPTTNSAVLGLRGIIVDTIEELGQPWPSSINRTPDLIVAYLESLMQLWTVPSEKGGDIYPIPSRRDEAFWRLTVGNLRHHGEAGEWAPGKPLSAFVSRKPATSTTLTAFQELLEFCRLNILLNRDEEQDGEGDLSPELRQFVKERGIMLHDIPGSSIPDSGRVRIAEQVSAQNLNQQQAVAPPDSHSFSNNTQNVPSSHETSEPTSPFPANPPPSNHIEVILTDSNPPLSQYPGDPQNPQASNTIVLGPSDILSFSTIFRSPAAAGGGNGTRTGTSGMAFSKTHSKGLMDASFPIKDRWLELNVTPGSYIFDAGRMRDKRPFVTKEKGYLGMAPEYARPGDLVVVFCGERVPFVVRPAPPAEEQSGDRYTLVGEAYCDGIMDGELEGRLEGGERRELYLI